MAVRFILGRAGSGKSHYALESIRQQLLIEPQGHPLLLLVPEQASFQAEYALVTTPGLSGIMRAQALSFRRLAYRIMQEVGGTIRTPINDTGKTMFLYKILHQYRDKLRFLHHAMDQTGFIANINELFNEFKRYSLTPAMLHTYCDRQLHRTDEMSPLLVDKLHDLALIYEAFETGLRETYIDAEEYLDILTYQLPDSHYIQEAQVWVDGFYGFTPQEFQVLSQLMVHAREVTITLCIDREYQATDQPDELDLFHPTARTLIQLQKIVKELAIDQLPTIHLPLQGEVLPRFSHQPSLAHLEQHYESRTVWRQVHAETIHNDIMQTEAESPVTTQNDSAHTKKAHMEEANADNSNVTAAHEEKPPAISIHAAVHRRAEIEGVAREMIRLAREEGYRWRDMAVMVRDTAQYEDELSACFTEHDIPYFFDQKRHVTDHPLIEFIRSALEIVQFNWQYDHVFRCVKTDFLLPLDDRSQTHENDESIETIEANESNDSIEAINSIDSINSIEASEATNLMKATDSMDSMDSIDSIDAIDSSDSIDSIGAMDTLDDVARLTRSSMDELENYVLAFGIRGRERWSDDKPWPYTRLTSLEDEERDMTAEQSAYLQRIHEARMAVVTPLLKFQQRMEKADHVQEQITALFKLLEDVHAAERLELWSSQAIDAGHPERAREHTQIWGMVMDTFDQMVEVIGDGETTIEMFTSLLETGLENITLGLVPPAIDQVLIGHVDRTRSAQVKFCFVLGVNDGVLPQKGLEDGILAEQERELLLASGLELAPGSRRRMLDEQFLIYTVLTRASEHLWLSYPLADDEGKAMLPSEIIRRVRTMFPRLQTNILFNEPLSVHEMQLQHKYIAHPERAMSYLITQLREWRQGVEIAPLWWDVYNWLCQQDHYSQKLERTMHGLFYRNQEPPLSERTRRELYGQQLQASISRMEQYVSCPFAQFISYGLRLRERREYRLEAPDIGQLFHASLSWIAKYLQRENVQWGDLSPKQCDHLAKAAIDEFTPRMQNQILLSSKRYHYIARKLQRIIGRAVTVLSEHARRGAFIPAGIELSFGAKGTLPPLSFTLDNGVQMDIIGRIDRVDRAESEQGVLLRVVDYKSSQTQLSLSDVYYGLSLQVLTYLDVVVTHAERWLGKKGIPAGVLYFHVHQPLLQVDNRPEQAEVERDLFQQFKMRGLLLADQDVIQQMDQTLQSGYSDMLPVGLRRDGGFYANSSVADERQWQLLRQYVRQTIRDIGTGITDGRVDIHPYRKGQHVACTFCAYKPICQFDQQHEDNAYNHLTNMNKETAWEWMQKEGER